MEHLYRQQVACQEKSIVQHVRVVCHMRMHLEEPVMEYRQKQFGNGGTLKVKATVYYKVNGKSYTNQASDSSRGGGVSAIARNKDFGNVYGGTGWHYIKSGAYTWENNTKIGTTW